MRLLVDTTYLLPAIGITVKEIPADGVIRLAQKTHEIHVSDVSIFELAAKGAKQVAAGILPAERVARGIRALVYDGTVTMIPTHESTVLLTAFELRSMLGDFIDCLILASAMNHCDALVTEDKDILNLTKNKELVTLHTRINPRFRIRTLAEIM